MSTLIERLTEVMQTMQWEHADLVRVSEVSPSAVSQWLGKGSKLIKTIGNMQAAERLEKATGYAALWIAKGEGLKFARKLKADGYSEEAMEIAALADLLSDKDRLRLKRIARSLLPDEAEL